MAPLPAEAEAKRSWPPYVFALSFILIGVWYPLSEDPVHTKHGLMEPGSAKTTGVFFLAGGIGTLAIFLRMDRRH